MPSSNSTSPFGPMEEKTFSKEKTKLEKLQDYFYEKTDEMFVQSIPSDTIRDMPPKYMYVFGIILRILLLAIFLSLFLDAYYSSLNQQFLSPLSGDTSSKYCETIPVANTGSYLATQDGFWQGNDGFEFDTATYIASVTSYTLSPSEYNRIMKNLYQDLSYAGNITTHYDLGTNLVYWSSFTALPDGSNAAQRFSLVGDPLVIFNREYLMGSISSIKGICNITSMASFDEGRGLATVSFPADDYLNDPTCASIANPLYVGYLPGVNSNVFSLYFDVRTLMTGMAMNLNIITFDQIVEITADRSTFTYNGATYNTSSYYDPQFPGMQPVTCIQGFPTPLCALKIGVVYALPIFLHKGNSTILPERCNCSRMSDTEKSFAYSECNLFSLLAGFVYYSDVTPNYLFQLIANYNYSSATINSLAFNAAFTASYWGRTSPYFDELNSEQSRHEMYDWCTVEGLNCTLVTFSLFDVNWDWAISEYYYQLQFGACQDSIATTWENWNKLIVTPFAPLIQQYEKCYTPPETVFLTQFGVSLSNLGAITPFCVIFFLSCVILYQRLTGDVIPQAYSKSERDDVLNAFAISLLLARDRQRAKEYGNSSSYSQENEQRLELQRTDSVSTNTTLNGLIRDLENDAEYHSNTYKLDGKIKQIQVDWNQLASKMNIISPLFHRTNSASSSLSRQNSNQISEKNTNSSSRTKQVEIRRDTMEDPTITKMEMQNFPLPSSTSSSAANQVKPLPVVKKEEIMILNKETPLNGPSIIYPPLLKSQNKRKILNKLDDLFEKISEIVQKNSVYANKPFQSSHHSSSSNNTNPPSYSSEYELYFYQLRFMKTIERSLLKITVNSFRNSQIDSDDETEDEQMMIAQQLNRRSSSFDLQQRRNSRGSFSSTISNTKDDVDEEEFVVEFYEKVYHLCILHTSIVMDGIFYESNVIRELYGNKVGYLIANQVYSLNDLYQQTMNASPSDFQV